MDVRIFQEQADRMNDMVGIVNPSPKDFTCSHDSNEDRNPINYTIKSREGIMLKRYIADHISNKLAQEILSSYKGIVTQELMDKTLASIRLYE